VEGGIRNRRAAGGHGQAIQPPVGPVLPQRSASGIIPHVQITRAVVDHAGLSGIHIIVDLVLLGDGDRGDGRIDHDRPDARLVVQPFLVGRIGQDAFVPLLRHGHGYVPADFIRG